MDDKEKVEFFVGLWSVVMLGWIGVNIMWTAKVAPMLLVSTIGLIGLFIIVIWWTMKNMNIGDYM